MAKVKRNVIVEGLSGTVGKSLVFRQMRDGSTIISTKPDFSNRVFSKGQLSHQKRFREAAAYARYAAKKNPIYGELAKGTTKTAYNIALSDWFSPPEIHEVQRQNGWIHIKATDNVRVAKVRVTIIDDQGQIAEQGDADLHNNQLWKYPTHVQGTTIQVEAWDLAGNLAKKSISEG